MIRYTVKMEAINSAGEMAMILYMEVMGVIIYKVDLATIRSTEEMVMISWLAVQVQISSIVDLEMDVVKDFNATEGDVHLANCEMIQDDND